MFNISEYIYLYVLVLQCCIWCHVVWYVCSYHPYKSPMLRDPVAQTVFHQGYFSVIGLRLRGLNLLVLPHGGTY